MSINLFDAGFYAKNNLDLGRAGLTTDIQLQSHFDRYGLDEKRAFSPFVDLSFYKSSNPDLAAAGLTSDRAVLNHLQNYGVKEVVSFPPL
ncbi:hypothetical protein [Tolypothrix sp. VBCCA 56010]|uniref:hypothetical protein n=1 Tax=Tolypothrix sp. VBCCA 56010 TaxID=3137731 RepID=UPI003D7CF72F